MHFKVFQWTARFCEKKVKAFKAGKLRSMKVSRANCELGGVSDCFGWFSDLWGDSPSTENLYDMGDRKNSQQPTVNHFLIHGPETFAAWELQSYIVSSFKAVWNTSNTQLMESMGLVY